MQGTGGNGKVHLPPALRSRPGTSPSLVSQTEAKQGGGGTGDGTGGREGVGQGRWDLTKSKYLWLQIKKALGKMPLRLEGESGPEVKRYLEKGATLWEIEECHSLPLGHSLAWTFTLCQVQSQLWGPSPQDKSWSESVHSTS